MSSYVEKYATNFFDNDNNKFRLQIFQYGYSGSLSNNITLAKSPVVINYSQDDDYFQPIIGSTCKLRFYVEESTGGSQWEDEDTNWNTANFFWERSEFEFLTPTYDREFKIKVLRRFASGETDTGASEEEQLKDTTASFTSTVKVGDLAINTTTGKLANVVNIVSDTFIEVDESIFSTTVAQNYEIFRNFWTGFIMQDSYTLPITSPPFVVEVYASDLIGTINGYNIDLTTERPEVFDIIQNCLKNINIQNASGTSGKSLDFSYKVLCRLNQFSTLTSSGSSNANPFEQVFIRSVDGLEDENGNYLNAKEVLISLLRMYNCRIFQHEGAWTIIDNASLALTSFSDGGGSYSKEFKTYDKSGTSVGTEAIASPVVTLNSSTSASTLQPVNDDFVKIIKRPAIRQRTQIRIKDTLKSQFSNGGLELGATRVPTYNFGFFIENWTIADNTKAFGVESTTKDTTGVQPIIYGITPYAGSRSAITIGSTSSNTVILTSTTANIGSTVEPLTFSFANYADDPDNAGNLSYQYKFRIKVTPTSGGAKYYDLDNQQWVSSATDGINSLSGSVQEQWNLNEFEIQPSPITGSVTLEIFLSKEDVYNNPNFRMYFDDFFLKGISDLEYFDTRTLIINSSFKDNSGVLPAFENRYGMLNDTKYSNCLVDSGGNPITGYKNFDGSVSDSATLETLMNRQRLNEFANSNDRYEGTFRKIADSNGFLTPLSMLSFPKILFNTFTVDNHLAIDNYEFDVAENRYTLSTHTPTQSNLTVAGDISSITSFYKIKPED